MAAASLAGLLWSSEHEFLLIPSSALNNLGRRLVLLNARLAVIQPAEEADEADDHCSWPVGCEVVRRLLWEFATRICIGLNAERYLQVAVKPSCVGFPSSFPRINPIPHHPPTVPSRTVRQHVDVTGREFLSHGRSSQRALPAFATWISPSPALMKLPSVLMSLLHEPGAFFRLSARILTHTLIH